MASRIAAALGTRSNRRFLLIIACVSIVPMMIYTTGSGDPLAIDDLPILDPHWTGCFTWDRHGRTGNHIDQYKHAVILADMVGYTGLICPPDDPILQATSLPTSDPLYANFVQADAAPAERLSIDGRRLFYWCRHWTVMQSYTQRQYANELANLDFLPEIKEAGDKTNLRTPGGHALPANAYTIGVHLRYEDFHNKTFQPSAKDPRFFFWCFFCGHDLVIEHIRAEIARAPAGAPVWLYIASNADSDDPDLKEVREEFAQQLAILEMEGVQAEFLPMVDMQVLIQCDSLLYNFWSTFSRFVMLKRGLAMRSVPFKTSTTVGAFTMYSVNAVLLFCQPIWICLAYCAWRTRRTSRKEHSKTCTCKEVSWTVAAVLVFVVIWTTRFLRLSHNIPIFPIINGLVAMTNECTVGLAHDILNKGIQQSVG